MQERYFPAFVGGPRHGGVRRSEQIATAVASHLQDRSIEIIPPPDNFRRLLGEYITSCPFQLLKALFESRHHEVALRDRVFWALCSIYYGHSRSWDLGSIAWIDYSSSFSRYVPEIVRAKGVEYVLFPQNIEFLVRGKLGELYGREFEREIAAIVGAKQCVCISDFDAAICEVFNRDVLTFPYCPGETDSEAFQEIRRTRSASPKMGFLAMGSANNPSTKQGFVELVELLSSKGVSKDYLTVAGFGTETLKASIGERAVVLGSVDRERLDSLLGVCKGVVVHQRQTSGFLTRLVEMNLCGVPVLVAGGYRQAKDLEKYGIFCDVDRFLSGEIPSSFEVFEKPYIKMLSMIGCGHPAGCADDRCIQG